MNFEEVVRDKQAIWCELADSIAAEVTISTSEGKLIVVNRACAERTGRQFDGHWDWASSDLIHPDDVPHAKAAWARALSTRGRYAVDVRSICADGEYRWVRSRGFPIREPEGKNLHWCTLHLDIDNRKKAELALSDGGRCVIGAAGSRPPAGKAMNSPWAPGIEPRDMEKVLRTWPAAIVPVFAAGEVVLPGRGLIAIIDDDESVRESLPDLLQEYGYEASAYSSAEEFLSADCTGQTDCLVLDLAMPGMSGADLYRELVRRHEEIPTVFITAHGDEILSRKLRQLGAIECLLKPFSDTALLGAIRAVLTAKRN